MLGQDDDPAHIAEQMQKSQVDANSADAEADHGPERRDVLRRSPQLPGQERAAADGDHLGRRDHERHLRVHLRRDRVRHGRAVHAGDRVGDRARLAGVAGRASSRATRSCRSATQSIPTFMQLRGGVTLGDLENGIPLRGSSRCDGEVVAVHTQAAARAASWRRLALRAAVAEADERRPPTLDNSPAARAKLVAPGRRRKE